MIRQLKIAALGIAAFLVAVTSPALAPLGAEENPPGKARVVAEYCVYRVWPGCLEDTDDRRAYYVMTRRDLGDGIYEDTYHFEGPVPGQEGRRGHLRRLITYRGLFQLSETRLRSFRYSLEEAQKMEDFEAGELERNSYLVWTSDYETADLAKLFKRLMNGEEIVWAEISVVSYKTYFCVDLENCDEKKNSREIESGTYTDEDDNPWRIAGEELLELPEGPVKVLIIDYRRSRFWYDPVSEQIVRATAINMSGDYQLYRLRLRAIDKSNLPQKE